MVYRKFGKLDFQASLLGLLKRKSFKVKKKKISFIILLGFMLILSLLFYIKQEHAQSVLSQNSAQETSQESTPDQESNSEESKDSSDSLSTQENQKLNDLYEQGLKLYYDRKFPEALDLFNQVLAIDPQNYKALNGKGATYAFQGRYSEGIALIKEAIQLKPDFVYARFNLGLAYELAGKYDQSIAAYKDALKLDDKDIWSYYGIASIYGRRGDVEKVIEWLRPAINLDPSVKAVAREEKDFNPVKNDPRFKALIESETSSISNTNSLISPVNFPILYYHSVQSEEGNELRMPPDQFEEQMKYLAEHGYQSITPDQLYNAIYHNGSLPAKPVLITFDDGYEDNYTNAYTIMKKYHFVGTVFLVGNYINSPGFLSVDQIKEMQAAGWTFGGHTANHLDLSKVNLETVVKELQDSRKVIEGYLGQPLKYFVYPFGGFTTDVAQKVKEDGYTMAFTTQRGWIQSSTDAYKIKRVYMYANMGIKEFVNRLTNPDY